MYIIFIFIIILYYFLYYITNIISRDVICMYASDSSYWTNYITNNNKIIVS